jgi:tetratricopeptide (TPR) repeat protein
MTLAELQMSVAKYCQAAEHYEEVLKLNVPSEDDEDEGLPLTQMIHTFNTAESNRRAGHSVPRETWKMIISLFEKFPALGGLPTMTANHYQAIHVAYAMIGDVAMAKECLRKALKAAETVNDLEYIFSVRDYRMVNRDGFTTTTGELLAALDRNELWDGTKLSVAQGEGGL